MQFCEQLNYYSISRKGIFSPRNLKLVPEISLPFRLCQQIHCAVCLATSLQPLLLSTIKYFLLQNPLSFLFLKVAQQLFTSSSPSCSKYVFSSIFPSITCYRRLTTQHVTNPFSFPSFCCVRGFVDSVYYFIFHTISSIDFLNPFPASHFMSYSTLSYADEKWCRKMTRAQSVRDLTAG